MTTIHLKNIIKTFKYLRPYLKEEIFIWILSLAIAGLSLVNPYLTKLIIDKAYALKDFSFFLKILILGGLIFIIISLLDALTQYLKQYILIRVRFDLQKTIFHNIENLPYSFFQEKTTGEYIYKLLNESWHISSFITSLIPEFFSLVPKFLLICAILFFLNWKITIFLILSTFFLYIPPFLVIRKIRERAERLLESFEDLVEIVREIFSNMQLVRVFGREKFEFKRYTKNLIKSIRINIAGTRLNFLSSFLDSGINKLVFGLVILYGGYNIIKGQMTLGSFTAIMIYINQLLGLQASFTQFFVHFSLGNISIQRLSTILESCPKEKEDENSKEFLISSGEIEFQDVSFGYSSDRVVLEHLNFRIEGGTKIGLIGCSGCGKTTLISLIVKLYRIQNGRIFIDSQDITFIKNKYLRDQIGVALQKPFLWNDTIRNNILYGNPKASSKEVLNVAEISCSYDFIKNLPNGFDTKVGEEAIHLSEGQKQRIALARAIIKNPKILIIDEGMSSLDSQTEDNIIDNIKRELRNTTLIIVSHRLSTIRKMDLVYFLEKANKISIGYHEQLVRENASYRELFASQIEEERTSVRA